MRIEIVAPDRKRFDLILRTVNAQLTLWTNNPQFSCRPVAKGSEITLIGYGKNADKDRWFASFASGIVDYLKPKHVVESTIDGDVMRFEYLYVIDSSEERQDDETVEEPSKPKRRRTRKC